MRDAPLLSLEQLTVSYATRAGPLRALDAVDLDIDSGETLALVGESGSGKSTAALAIMGLLGPEAAVSGRIAFLGRDLTAMPELELSALRGAAISVVFQDPFTSLNPSLPVGFQVAEPLMHHRRMPRSEALALAVAALRDVGLRKPAEVARAYPHQLSGGMRQRVLIAAALVNDPQLLILDEPTTALDVTVEAQVLDLLGSIRSRRGLSMLYITHNIRVVNRIADRVCVLYAGRVLEEGPRRDVLHLPAHPYTKGLLASLPSPKPCGREGRLAPIGGRFPNLANPPRGCIFEPRCPFAEVQCGEPQATIPLSRNRAVRCWRSEELAAAPWPSTPAGERLVDRCAAGPALPLIELRDVGKTFHLGGLPVGLSWRRLFGLLPWPALQRRSVCAVDSVTLQIGRGEVLGLVGESGSGKSTLGRLALRLIPPSRGQVVFEQQDITRLGPGRLGAFRRAAQIVFQNPESSLNPRRAVGDAIGRAVTLFSGEKGAALRKRVEELLEKVGLPRQYFARYPHQLSGGEKQRVGIARALAPGPAFIVCDEPVSALDVSVQATVLNLMADLRDGLGLSYLLISHDLAVVAHLADRIAVMYAGRICEVGPAKAVLAPPYHPYTEALLSAVAPLAEDSGARRIILTEEDIGTPKHTGCPFQGRCPRKIGAICETVPPPILTAAPGHTIACHLPLAELMRTAAAKQGENQ